MEAEAAEAAAEAEAAAAALAAEKASKLDDDHFTIVKPNKSLPAAPFEATSFSSGIA